MCIHENAQFAFAQFAHQQWIIFYKALTRQLVVPKYMEKAESQRSYIGGRTTLIPQHN